MLGVDIDGMRRAWRTERSSSLQRRRRLAALAGVGVADFAIISLYQLGVVKHLPDLPGRLFDSDRVNASKKAYALGVPDGPLGALFYAGMMMTAGFGGTHRTGRPRVAKWVQGVLATGGVISALDYLRDMLFVQKKVCPYCVVGAGLNLAIFALAAADIRGARREAWA